MLSKDPADLASSFAATAGGNETWVLKLMK